MSQDFDLTPEDVAEIVAILDGSHFERLDIKTGRFALRIARSGDGWTQQQDWRAEAPAALAGTGTATPAATVVDDADGTAIRAPLPGTFYRSPQPGAPAFVEVGDSVGSDTVIGIIETMKLMNPVHAGCSGAVTAILCENGVMVAGQDVLMRVTPA